MPFIKEQAHLVLDEAELGAKQIYDRFPRRLRFITVCCLVALIPGYFVAKAASYNYWTKKYQNYVITAKPSFTNPKDPQVSQIFLATTGGSDYSAGVQISNENLDLAAPSVSYEFVFFNASGEQIYKADGQTFLLPNETKYLVVPHFTASGGVANSSFHITSKITWQKPVSIAKIDIQPNIPNVYNQTTPQAYVVEGSYYNNSPYLLNQVMLTFVLYDASHNIIAFSQRQDYSVGPFEHRGYNQTWPGIVVAPGGSVQVFAQTDPLDPSNLSVPTQPSNSASDLSRPRGSSNSN